MIADLGSGLVQLPVEDGCVPGNVASSRHQPSRAPGASEAASGLDASLGLRGATFGTCLPEPLGIS